MTPIIVTVWVLIIGNSGTNSIPVIGPQNYSSLAACSAVKKTMDTLTTSTRKSSCVETQVVIGYKPK